MFRNVGICSTAVRLICEIFFLLILFVPILLFVTQWPNVEHVIQDKILAVSEVIFDEISFLLFFRKHV